MYNDVKDCTYDDLLNDAFNEYFDRLLSEAPSDEELSARYPFPKSSLRKARRVFAAKKQGRSLALVYARRVAIIVLVCALASFGGLMIGFNVEAEISKFFIVEHDKFVEIEPNEANRSETSADSETEEDPYHDLPLHGFKVGYVPEGFELQEDFDPDIRNYYRYLDENENYMSVFIGRTKNTGISLDNERYVHETITVNGREAHLAYNYDKNYGDIVFFYGDYTINVGGYLEKDELIKVAESIKR